MSQLHLDRRILQLFTLEHIIGWINLMFYCIYCQFSIEVEVVDHFSVGMLFLESM